MKTSAFGSDSEGKNSGNDGGIVNMEMKNGVRISRRDGSYEDFPDEVSTSAPDENGNYKQLTVKTVHLDDQGNPLPSDMAGVSVSHTGRLIPPGSLAVCTSQFHQLGLSRNIYIDVDGSVTEEGAICLTCLRRRTVLNIVWIVVGICFAIGLFKGLGWF
ncbi:MAG: hypothetical protein ACOYOS_23905 [Syntrophales bacterium]